MDQTLTRSHILTAREGQTAGHKMRSTAGMTQLQELCYANSQEINVIIQSVDIGEGKVWMSA